MVKNLKECQNLAQLYNQRERLFGQEVTQVARKLIKYATVHEYIHHPKCSVILIMNTSCMYVQSLGPAALLSSAIV